MHLKNLVRKKVTMAASIKTLETNLGKNIFPKSVDFRFITNSTRDPTLKNRWASIILNCKKELTRAMIDDLYTKYGQIKDTINTKLIELETHLEPEQYAEIKAALNIRAKGMTSVFLKKKEQQFNPPKGRRRPQAGPRPQKGGKGQPQTRNNRPQNGQRPQFKRNNQKQLNLKALLNNLQDLLIN